MTRKKSRYTEAAITKRRLEDIRAGEVHEALHAAFFNRSPVNVREVRDRLDPVLKAMEIREILKLDLTNDGDGDDPTYN